MKPALNHSYILFSLLLPLSFTKLDHILTYIELHHETWSPYDACYYVISTSSCRTFWLTTPHHEHLAPCVSFPSSQSSETRRRNQRDLSVLLQSVTDERGPADRIHPPTECSLHWSDKNTKINIGHCGQEKCQQLPVCFGLDLKTSWSPLKDVWVWVWVWQRCWPIMSQSAKQ